MDYRPLGATGLQVSAIALGGAPAGLANYLSPYDPEVAQQVEAGREVMREFRDTLRALAK